MSMLILLSDVNKVGSYIISVTFQENNESVEKVAVAVKQGNLLGMAFHPELTADTRWYSLNIFLPSTIL